MSVEYVDPKGYFLYKEEPDGSIVFLELIEMVGGIAPDGENVTLSCAENRYNLLGRVLTSALMPPDSARELAEILADLVARLDGTAS